jgi:XTP/dITP diphosphohydrolase
MSTREEQLAAFGRLLDVMDELREKCPWDKKQTNESLRANTIEETYELSNAIIQGHPDEIRKELGDLLRELLDLVIEEALPNDREVLLAEASARMA